jgi:hypothetical protein
MIPPDSNISSSTDGKPGEFHLGHEQGLMDMFDDALIYLPATFMSSFFNRFAEVLYKSYGIEDNQPAIPLLEEVGAFIGYSSIGAIDSKYRVNFDEEMDNEERRLVHYLKTINEFGWGKWEFIEPFRTDQLKLKVAYPFESNASLAEKKKMDSRFLFFTRGIGWALAFFANLEFPTKLSYQHFRAIYYDRRQSWNIQIETDTPQKVPTSWITIQKG